MPQIGFFVGAAGAGIFGIPAGVANLMIAWDPYNAGPRSPYGVVYKSLMLSSVVGGGKIRNYEPIQVAQYKRPHPTSSFSPLGLDTVKFSLTGHSNLSAWVDLTLKALDETGKEVYSISEGTGKDFLRVRIKGFTTVSSFNFEDTMDMDLERPGRFGEGRQSRFDALMTPDGSLW